MVIQWLPVLLTWSLRYFVRFGPQPCWSWPTVVHHYCLSFGDFSQFISPFARSSPYFVIRDTKWHRNFTCNGFTKNTWTCSNVLLDCIDLNRAPDKTDWCRYNRSVVGFAAPRICPVKYKNQMSSMYNHSDWRRVCDPDRKDLVGRG